MSPNDVLTVIIIVAVTIVISVSSVAQHLSASRKARAQLTAGEDYRNLADEYRRLSDMAITAQEHVDLRLTDLGVQVDALRDQLDQMQRILKEVE
jgi:type II secretory pathway pseudopilin PulG